MLTTRMSPKIRVKPLATTKKSAASVTPFSVTTANCRRSSLAFATSQMATAAATTASTTRRPLPAALLQVCGCAGPAAAGSDPCDPAEPAAVGSSGV
jgi:hypothetical protein